jgi:hypothetical protein
MSAKTKQMLLSTAHVFIQFGAHPMVVDNRDVKLEGLWCLGDVFLRLRIYSLACKKEIESLGCNQKLHAAGGDTVKIAHASFPLRPVTHAIFRQDSWRRKCVIDNLKEQLARKVRQSRHDVVRKRVAMAMCKVMSPAVPRYDTCTT